MVLAWPSLALAGNACKAALLVFDPEADNIRDESNAVAARADSFLWSPDDTAIAVQADLGTNQGADVEILKLGDETLNRVAFVGAGAFVPQQWTPDGSKLLLTWRSTTSCSGYPEAATQVEPAH